MHTYWCNPASTGAEGLRARQERAAAFALKVRPIAAALRTEDRTLGQIAALLVGQGIHTRRGANWTAASVRTLLQAVEAR